MSQHFILAYVINTNNFIIKLYHFEDVNDYVNQNIINEITNNIYNITIAKNILDVLVELNGITKIEIFDKEYVLLIDYNFILE